MVRVYLSGPITLGDVGANIHRAIEVYHQLLADGYAVFCPHLDMLAHIQSPQPYETWMRNDLAWVSASHVVLRLPGESRGSDQETEYARMLGIPVVYSIEALNGYRSSEPELVR